MDRNTLIALIVIVMGLYYLLGLQFLIFSIIGLAAGGAIGLLIVYLVYLFTEKESLEEGLSQKAREINKLKTELNEIKSMELVLRQQKQKILEEKQKLEEERADFEREKTTTAQRIEQITKEVEKRERWARKLDQIVENWQERPEEIIRLHQKNLEFKLQQEEDNWEFFGGCWINQYSGEIIEHVHDISKWKPIHVDFKTITVESYDGEKLTLPIQLYKKMHQYDLGPLVQKEKIRSLDRAKLTKNETEVCKLLKESPDLTFSDLKAYLGLADSSLSNALTKLQSLGLVIKEGNKYRLNPDKETELQ